MTFFDIFSNDKNNETKKIKYKIIIDNREKNSLVLSELVKLGFEIELKQLSIADYIVNDIAIERKTISDLQNSIINKRIFSQLNDLKQYTKSLMIIEGEQIDDKLFIHENALRGFLLNVALEYPTSIIFAKDEKDTARYISVLAKKTPNIESSLRESQKFKSNKERIQFILEGFPNIGPVKAKKLINKFKSLKEIINAKLDQLEPILGKNANNFKSLIDNI